MPDGSTIHHCPLECGWSCVEPPSTITVTDGRVARVDRKVVEADRKVVGHASDHGPDEWGPVIARLRYLVDMWENGYGDHVAGVTRWAYESDVT